MSTAAFANIGGRLTPIDRLYAVHFVEPDGELASIDAVSSDWLRFSAQTPAGYPASYDYPTLRYTNWQKAPVLFSAIRTVGSALFGDAVMETASVRSWILNLQRSAARVLEGRALLLLAAYGMLRWNASDSTSGSRPSSRQAS